MNFVWLTSNIGRPRPLRSNVPDKITLFENFLSYQWQQWILVSLICFWVFGILPDTVEQCPNIIGLLNWYCWILARVGCKNVRACECILKPTNANIHHNQFQVNIYLDLTYCECFMHIALDSMVHITCVMLISFYCYGFAFYVESRALTSSFQELLSHSWSNLVCNICRVGK